jgi:hypothetical protein
MWILLSGAYFGVRNMVGDCGKRTEIHIPYPASAMISKVPPSLPSTGVFSTQAFVG